MRNLMGNRNHGSLLKKVTAPGMACLLLVAGLPLPAAAEESCKDWNTAKFFKSATVDEVRACLSAGRDPNEQDPKGLTALHWAARKTSDPAVIEVLMEAGANPRSSSIAGRTPWDYARRNDRIKGSAAYQQLRMTIPSEAKKADWSRVQALQPGQKIVVRAFKGRGPKVQGAYVSSDAAHLVVRRQSGQTVSIPKDHIRVVLGKRRVRHAVLIGAAAGFALLAIAFSVAGGADFTADYILVFGGAGAGLGALTGLAIRAAGGNYMVYQAEN